jgi:hypothetical protein
MNFLRKMNGFEKHKETCISIIFAWTRGYYKLCNKHLIQRVLSHLKIDLSGKHQFTQIQKELVTNAQKAGYHIRVEENSVTLMYMPVFGGWVWQLVYYTAKDRGTLMYKTCPLCLAPRFPIVCRNGILSPDFCINGHELNMHDATETIDLTRFKIDKTFFVIP